MNHELYFVFLLFLVDGSLYPGAKHFSQSPPPEYNNDITEEGVEVLNSDENHARSWEELDEDSDDDSAHADHAIQLSQAEVN